MGLSIAYRGRLADLTRVEDFEDRLLDLALEVGGLAHIWRSYADHNPRRVVRGVILNLAPGQESTSLLLSPEGWLIGLADIEDAEEGRLTEPPWCFTKTQFGPVEGHVALVEMFSVLRREYLPDLEVSDEGGYWETRDFAELARRHARVQRAIDGLAEGLHRHGLSREAAEDPEILIRRIERIAAQVQRSLRRPPEHAPVEFPDDELLGGTPDPESTEAKWDEMFKHNRRQQEALLRAVEDRRSRGQDDEAALESALDDVAPEVPDEEAGRVEEPWTDEEQDALAEAMDEQSAAGDVDPGDGAWGATPLRGHEESHPLLKCATGLLQRFHEVFRDADPPFAS